MSWPVLVALQQLREHDRDRTHRLVLIGTSSDERRAVGLGLRSFDRINPPAGFGAERTLARLIRDHGPIDVLHAWGAGAVIASGRVRGAGRRIASLHGGTSTTPRSARRGLRRSLDRFDRVIFPTDQVRSAWTAGDWKWPPSSVIPMFGERVADASRVRAAKREAWGVDDATTVVLPATDPPYSLNAREAVFQVGVVGLAGRRVRVVLDRASGGLERARRFAHAQQLEDFVVIDDGSPVERLAASDIALFMRRGGRAAGDAGDPGIVRWALANGLLIVAPRDGEEELSDSGPGVATVRPHEHAPYASALHRCLASRDTPIHRASSDAATAGNNGRFEGWLSEHALLYEGQAHITP